MNALELHPVAEESCVLRPQGHDLLPDFELQRKLELEIAE